MSLLIKIHQRTKEADEAMLLGLYVLELPIFRTGGDAGFPGCGGRSTQVRLGLWGRAVLEPGRNPVRAQLCPRFSSGDRDSTNKQQRFPDS